MTEKRSPLVRIKDFALFRVKASFKVFGSLFSLSIRNLAIFTFVGGGAVLFVGDVLDPFEATGIVAQQEIAPNILIEIRDIVQDIEQGSFPPGPPVGLPAEFLQQVDDIENKIDCLVSVLNGVEISC